MIKPVPIDKFYRLINHGVTALISGKHGNDANVMSASWVCPLDFSPNAKLTVVRDKSTHTRTLIEQSGYWRGQTAVFLTTGAGSLTKWAMNGGLCTISIAGGQFYLTGKSVVV